MLLSCLRKICQGSTNVSFQRSVVVLKREYKTLLAYSPSNGAEKNASFKITYLPSLQWKLMQFWNLLIDRQGLVKNLKTWWKLGENLMNFQNRVNPWRKSWWISNTWWISKTWWIPGDIQNVVKTWWISKPGENVGECENLVNFPVFTKRKKCFAHWRILKRLLHSRLLPSKNNK